MILGATTPLTETAYDGGKSQDYSAKCQYGTPLSISPKNHVTHRIPKRTAHCEENTVPTEVKANCLDV